MLILLPPSEGKTAPPAGPTLDLDTLSFPGLDGLRRRVLDELVRLCRGEEHAAAAVLGLGPKQRADVVANAHLRTLPCAPASTVYSGVLFDALGYATLTRSQRARADQRLVIASALWGLLRPVDAIPAYRLSGSVTLPGLGTLAAHWRAGVAAEIARADGLVVDLRSSTYVALGPIPPSVADRAVTVRVLQERAGRRTVVSHSNKATKGRIARALVSTSRTPASVRGLVAQLGAAGFRVEEPPAVAGRPRVLDVIVTEA